MLNDSSVRRITALTKELINQEDARVIVEPKKAEPGFWFGGGNIVQAPDGTIYVVGRYRNSGDSTTGIKAGERGAELAIFSSTDSGKSFHHILSFSKKELGYDRKNVLSIEGAALSVDPDGVELFVSTEKSGIPYPAGLETFQKPGTGVWTIDRLRAPSVPDLSGAPVTPFLGSSNPEYLHVKDPVIHHSVDGDLLLLFCTHPFNWSSSNSAFLRRPAGREEPGHPVFDFFRRGTTWDVAVSRITDVLSLPHGLLAEPDTVQLIFYDGAECMRQHDENPRAVKRPRGYSCEEIAGLALATNDQLTSIERVSTTAPMFLSPWGTHSCRYIHTCAGRNGILATWQQSRESGEQALVMHSVHWDRVRAILGGHA